MGTRGGHKPADPPPASGCAGPDGNTVQLINPPSSPSVAAQGGSADMLVQLTWPLQPASPLASPAPSAGTKADRKQPRAPPATASATAAASIKPAIESVFLNGLQCTRLPLARTRRPPKDLPPPLPPLPTAAAAFTMEDCGTADWPLDDIGLLAGLLDDSSSSNSSSNSSPLSWAGLANSSSLSDSNSNSSTDELSTVNIVAFLAAVRQLSCVSQLCCGLQVVPSSVVSITNSSNSSADASNSSTDPAVAAADGPPESLNASGSNTTQVGFCLWPGSRGPCGHIFSGCVHTPAGHGLAATAIGCKPHQILAGTHCSCAGCCAPCRLNRIVVVADCDGLLVPSLCSRGSLQEASANAAAIDSTLSPVALQPADPASSTAGLVVGLVVAGVATGSLGALAIVLLRHRRQRRRRDLLAEHVKQLMAGQQGLVRHGSGASSNGSGEGVLLCAAMYSQV